MKRSSLFMGAATAVMAGCCGAMLANSFLPKEKLNDYIWGLVQKAITPFSTDMTTIVINERSGGLPNKMFHDAQAYMATRITLSTSNRLSVVKRNGVTGLLLLENDAFLDTFRGIKIRWILRTRQIDRNTGGRSSKVQYYDLIFPKKERDLVIESYLPFVSLEAESSPFLVIL
ncbi:PREDICTED: protein HYPER-SENSITIVITY-RELATED 4-like [Camelina sativa]|uniref:Protein HYPER-SENSITIVITY-RELATED 4-like n=1 Tax=Camelina sativa TaxID=90675 RepID=A0ABM0Y357_CAMSA|nr:PREDICTED: protein HYPER-SENSITIVITY-RELATED 4-like [Camelina sativa]